MDNIDLFLGDRKDKWLKERLKKAKNEDETQVLYQEANQKFSLLPWLIDAAKRVSQLTMVSHIGKFTHPSAKNSPVIADNKKSLDGYVRTGNVTYELDVLGNAAAMDVYKFLSLTLEDEKTILAHLEENTDVIKKRIGADQNMYQALAQGLLEIKGGAVTEVTDSVIKQVYFPLNNQPNSYHLLSILTPSGLVTELKQRIDTIKFSEQTKLAREARKKRVYIEYGYEDIPDLTVISYGGSKPQNISVLNNKNAGRAYLLASVPPSFEEREIRKPTKDFFKNTLVYSNFRQYFNHLTDLIKQSRNNYKIRDDIERTTLNIIDEIMVFAYRVRKDKDETGWSLKENYQSLPKFQCVWLDEQYKDERTDNPEWADKVCTAIARWIIDRIEFIFKKDDMILGTAEFQQVVDWVKQTIQTDKEGLL